MENNTYEEDKGGKEKGRKGGEGIRNGRERASRSVMTSPTTLSRNVLLSEPKILERSQRYVNAWTTLTLSMKRLPLEVEILGRER